MLHLRERGIAVAVASAAPSRAIAVELLKCLGLYTFFVEVCVRVCMWVWVCVRACGLCMCEHCMLLFLALWLRLSLWVQVCIQLSCNPSPHPRLFPRISSPFPLPTYHHVVV